MFLLLLLQKLYSLSNLSHTSHARCSCVGTNKEVFLCQSVYLRGSGSPSVTCCSSMRRSHTESQLSLSLSEKMLKSVATLYKSHRWWWYVPQVHKCFARKGLENSTVGGIFRNSMCRQGNTIFDCQVCVAVYLLFPYLLFVCSCRGQEQWRLGFWTHSCIVQLSKA